MRRRGERGQAMVIVALILGIFLLGAVGLAIDTSQLYVQRQMAQTAADAAVQAGILSIFNGTNVGGNAFAGTTSYSHTCGTTDGIAPCAYARLNGFGSTASDTVVVDVPTAAAVGVSSSILSPLDTVNLLRVKVTRSVPTWFIPMLGGAAAANINAVASAAIAYVNAPQPIVVTHPTKSGVLSMNGNDSITITGGPQQSIQINSSSTTALNLSGGPSIDLSTAGPNNSGGDFGVFGNDPSPGGNLKLGSTGHYISPSSRTLDPFISVPAPAVPPAAPAKVTGGCGSGCDLYSPGLYNGGLKPGKTAVQFKPGIYYIQNGSFDMKQVAPGTMCTTCGTDGTTGTGMLVYHTGTGIFDIGNQAQLNLVGADIPSDPSKPPTGPYYGILFFQDRNAPFAAHQIGKANGCFTFKGTLYITNSQATMLANSGQYQEVDYSGGPCTNTVNQGEIITGLLSLSGGAALKMSLFPTASLPNRKIALVQ